ncbi:MAG: DUF2520 domain-containing protein [Flavobacteriales bacterium]|nr:DUF2520 domain-containing protein [Flavobacteriales bacterium]
MNALKIAFIGSGNVAWHLAPALDGAGHSIIQIISRTKENAQKLAAKVGADSDTLITNLLPEADICIIAVSDGNLAEVVRQIPYNRCTVVHTCGSQSIEVLKGCSENYGIFYPLQTFSKNRAVNMFEVPIMIECNDPNKLDFLRKLGDSISNKVFYANSHERLQYHFSAVLVNNFVNRLFFEAETFLSENNLDFNVLKPIIVETAKKVLELSPQDAQTGPALRGDKITLEKHRQLIANNAPLLELYDFLTNRISNYSVR